MKIDHESINALLRMTTRLYNMISN